MKYQEKEIFYNDMASLLQNEAGMSELYLYEICIKNNSKEEKLLEIKEWMEFEDSYTESEYTKKEYKRFQNIYKKICKMLESLEV